MMDYILSHGFPEYRCMHPCSFAAMYAAASTPRHLLLSKGNNSGWENKVKGPWINHTCCAVHCICEYVPTSTGSEPVEFLADYGEDYLKVLRGKCRCCAHTRATAQCRFSPAGR